MLVDLLLFNVVLNNICIIAVFGTLKYHIFHVIVVKAKVNLSAIHNIGLVHFRFRCICLGYLLDHNAFWCGPCLPLDVFGQLEQGSRRYGTFLAKLGH